MSTSQPGRGSHLEFPVVFGDPIGEHYFTLCCAIDADRENSRVPAHVGELDPQHITRFGAAPSARNLVGPASAWTRRTAGLSLPAA
jgi:hypothetical protein